MKARDFSTLLEQLLTNRHSVSEDELAGIEGLAYYLSEDYEMALVKFEQAIVLNPNRKEWQELHEQAQANCYAKINLFVPEQIYFQPNKLISAPESSGDLLAPISIRSHTGRWQLARMWIGNVSGAILSVFVDVLTQGYGKIAGYRDTIWTNWYRRPSFLGLVTIAYMREKMYRHNLISTYPPDALIGFLSNSLVPPLGVTHFRTADGSWNNLNNPKEGAAGTRFLRNVSLQGIRVPSMESILDPNPRELSRIFLTRGKEMKEVPFLNMLAVAWIQFQTHDWVSHGEILQNELFEIPLAADDPARIKYQQTKMFVGKTQPDPTRKVNEPAEISFINEVTHWWDASQIYGSDVETMTGLRTMQDGKMNLAPGALLPRDKKGIEKTGFVRNWWVGLAMMHTLFVREHNAICDHLIISYPQWKDNRLFHTARLINSALIAKIHSIEWNTAINPNPILEKGNLTNWYGMLTHVLRKRKNWKTVADINVRNTEMGGVVGNPIQKHGSVYGLTQEFVAVYRLHSLLPEELLIQSLDGRIKEKLPFAMSRQSGSGKITDKYGMANLFFSFGNQNPGQLVLNNYPKFMQELSIPGNPVYDLGAVDILRARERGVPRYNEFRRQFGLHPIKSFDDLTSDQECVAKLKMAYGEKPDDVEKLDLLIGTLAEEYRPFRFAFGETVFQIFLLNATRRLQADRFYTDCYTSEYYTQEGLEWIDNNTLKSVLLRHYPEFKKTGLANIENAFEPWDEDDHLEINRHPLGRMYKNRDKTV